MKSWKKWVIGGSTVAGLGIGAYLTHDKYQDNQQEEAQAAKLEAEEKEKAAQEKAAQEAIAEATREKTNRALYRQWDREIREKEKREEAKNETPVVDVKAIIALGVDNELAIQSQEAWCQQFSKVNGEPVSGTVNAYAITKGEKGTTAVNLCEDDGKGEKVVDNISCDAAPKNTHGKTFSYSCQEGEKKEDGENGEKYEDWYLQRNENDHSRVYRLADSTDNSGATANRDPAVSVAYATGLSAVCSTNNNGTTCVSSEGWEYRVATLTTTRGFVGVSIPNQWNKTPSLEKRVGNLEERVGDGEVRDQLHEAVLTNHAAKLKLQAEREADNARIINQLLEDSLSPGDAAANAEAEHQKRMKR